MNRLIMSGLVVALSAGSLAVAAQEKSTTESAAPTKTMGMRCMGMKGMDANGDGLISKDEFTKHHEAMWDKMKKDANGNVSVKDMEAMHAEKMKQ